MRKIIGLIVGGIIGAIVGCLANYLCIEWVCDLANCFVSAGGRHSDTGVSSSTVCTIFVIICVIAGIIIGFIIGKSADEEEIIQLQKQEEQRRKYIQYIESLEISDVLSRNVRNYIKYGRTDNDYYDYKNSCLCSDYANDCIKDVVNFYKKRLLNNIYNGVDYETKYGVIREVYVGKLHSANNYYSSSKERVYIGSDSVNISYHSNYSDSSSSWNEDMGRYSNILREHGFILKQYDEYSEDYTSYCSYDDYVYAYIKM